MRITLRRGTAAFCEGHVPYMFMRQEPNSPGAFQQFVGTIMYIRNADALTVQFAQTVGRNTAVPAICYDGRQRVVYSNEIAAL